MARTFNEFIRLFGVDELPDAEALKRPGAEKDPFSSVVKIGKRYFYDPKGLLKLAQEKHWDAFSVGLYLGEEKGDFRPTSALIDLLAARSEKRVMVGSKAAWLYLCGRDILMDGALRPGDYVRDELVFVVDSEGEILGYGRIFANYDSKLRNKIYVKHQLDKGEYLRRER
jgi:ribosome biogenesis protein Nip4